MKKDAKICIIGHNGMLGHAIWNKLKNMGYMNLKTNTQISYLEG